MTDKFKEMLLSAASNLGVKVEVIYIGRGQEAIKLEDFRYLAQLLVDVGQNSAWNSKSPGEALSILDDARNVRIAMRDGNYYIY